ncbi:MAG: carboxylesterase family protein [Eubacteriales bacterium]|nr:carboxylesterase family protein [Eubacteriales bacterium]
MKKILALLLALALTLSAASALAAEQAPYVDYAFAETTQGWLMGYHQDTTYIFKGIQYGTAERFMPAKMVEPWTGVKAALIYGTTSPNSSTSVSISSFVDNMDSDMVQNEDCLYLNVWTQALDATAKKPVVFFLHGGGLSSGASNELACYDGKNISEYGDMVYVDINHRLNILGYLDLSAYGEEYKYSGNNGLADTVLALQWVHDNIAYFGGDPDNVTIVGQSGGGSKVNALLGTPAAKGLFHKAMQCSGGANGTGTLQEDARVTAAAVVESCKTIYGLTSDEEAIAKMKTITMDELYAVAAAADHVSYDHVIDGDYYPEKTYDAETGKWCDLAKDIPIIISNTFGELQGADGTLVMPMLINMAGASFDPANPDAFLANVYKPNMTEENMLELVTAKYGDSTPAILEQFHYGYPCRDTVDVLSVNRARADSTRYALNKYNQGGAPVYQCVFSYEYPIMGGIQNYHTGGDLPFWFYNLSTRPYMVQGDEENAYKVAKAAASALVAFAYTGDPSTEELPWSAFTAENGESMNFDDVSQVISYPDAKMFELMIEAVGPVRSWF